MDDIDKLVRGNIKNLKAYSSARDEYQTEDGIFLDANELPYGEYNRYPDPYQRKLKKAISKMKEIEEEKIFLGNGSDEILDLLFRVFCKPKKDKALIFTPTYGMYQVLAAINEVEVLLIPLNKDFQINLEDTIALLQKEEIKLLFICTPNNPTANSIDEKIILQLLDSFKGIVIIDEAYIDFCPSLSWQKYIDEYPNLIVLQTFSKGWGLAGVRLGMAFANPNCIKYLNKIKPPYNISSLNQTAVLDAIQNQAQLKKRLQEVAIEKEKLQYELNRMEEVLKVYPSDTNFLLIKVKDADGTYQKLIDQKLIVRNRNKDLPNCLRITIGTARENTILIQALKEIRT